MDAAVMKPVDRDALERAIADALARQKASNVPRRDGKTQIEDMLEDRPWLEVAEFCSYGCQMRSLQLRPWMWPPCWVDTDDRNPEHAPAVALLKRLLANNLSRFEPDPVTALAAIEARASGDMPPAA